MQLLQPLQSSYDIVSCIVGYLGFIIYILKLHINCVPINFKLTLMGNLRDASPHPWMASLLKLLA